MTRAIPRIFLALCLTLCLAAPAAAQYGGAGGAGGGKAGEQSEQASEKKKRESKWSRKKEGGKKEWGKEQVMGPRTAKRYYEAYELYQAEHFDKALQVLGKVSTKRLKPFERAKLYQMYAFVMHGKEDLIATREYFEKALAEDALPPDQQTDLQFNIARMYIIDQQWDEVIAKLDRWFEMVEEPNSSAYNLLALAYFQKQEYDKALEPAQKSVDLSEEPQEGWIRLLLALRLMRQEYAEAAPLLEDLVRRFPKKAYWTQLSTVYGAIGSYEQALVPLQLAYTQELLTEDSEVRRLAQLMMFLELPYLAALVMEKGYEDGVLRDDVEGWEMLSNSWIAAREYDKAVAPLETAATLAETGDLFVRLAQVHIQREKWRAAAGALRKAIDKGGLKAPGDAQLLMGIAYYSDKKPAQARGWFVRARGYATTRQEAEVWIQYVDREIQMLEAQRAGEGGQTASVAG